ncbi:MAG TPA: hypothetical protein PKW44_02995 [Methylophilaceae bacterium]|nr:hypothetical protein [Methylophilaceae bacterium]HQR60227.1 hypothetical protein [Methylophilaceae bacterium]
MLLVIQTAAWAEDLEQASSYELGKGWQVPGTSFNLGGYASGGLSDDHGEGWVLGMNDLSLFVRWEGEGKLRLFSELDLEEPVGIEEGVGLTTKHAYLGLERLYLDYLYSEKLNFRGGKFLTPIGRWNLLHAAPLVWTTTRPLITEYTFPTNATGAMAYGTLPLFGTEVDYSVYSAIGNDWRPDPKLDPFEEAHGLHFNVPLGRAGQLGMSYANFEQKSSSGEHQNLVGLDYYWEHNRLEISSEAVYRSSDDGGSEDEKGLFVQGAIPLTERLHGIVRYEVFDQAGNAPTINLWLAGLALRVAPSVLLKAEYSHANHGTVEFSHGMNNVPDGLFTSFAIMF